MKKVFMILTIICSIFIIGNVSAAENDSEDFKKMVGDLKSVFTAINNGSELGNLSLIHKDKIYYKYTRLTDEEFTKYEEAIAKNNFSIEREDIINKYKTNVENFMTATGELNIPNGWTKLENNKFVFQNLEAGKGYFIEIYIVAEVEGKLVGESTGDIYKAKDATTMEALYDINEVLDFMLGLISGIEEESKKEETTQNNNNNNTVQPNNKNTSTEKTTQNTQYVQTTQNPNTGLNDCLKYIVPLALLIGSTIIVKKNKLVH